MADPTYTLFGAILVASHVARVCGEEVCRYYTHAEGQKVTTCPEVCCHNYVTMSRQVCCSEFPPTTMFAVSSLGVMVVLGCLIFVFVYICNKKCGQLRNGRRHRHGHGHRHGHRSRSRSRPDQVTPEISVLSPPPYEAIVPLPLYGEASSILPGIDDIPPPKYTEKADDVPVPPEYSPAPINTSSAHSAFPAVSPTDTGAPT